MESTSDGTFRILFFSWQEQASNKLKMIEKGSSKMDSFVLSPVEMSSLLAFVVISRI